MPRKKSVKQKIREGYGTGSGSNYKAFIRAGEFGSVGTTSRAINPKLGRAMDILSQGELGYAYKAIWDDNIIDIQEQYPIDLSISIKTAEFLGFKHPHDDITPMTIDQLISFSDGHKLALCVKYSRASIQKNRALQILAIEKISCNNMGFDWKLSYTEDLDQAFVCNIRLVMQYYKAEHVHDIISFVKHLIAIKVITVPMAGKKIDFKKIAVQNEEAYEIWKKQAPAYQLWRD